MGGRVDERNAKALGVDNAGRRQGKLLMITDEQVEYVDLASTPQVIDALIQVNKDFDLLLEPNGGYAAGCMSEQDCGMRRLYDFSLRHLAGQPTPNCHAQGRSAADAALGLETCSAAAARVRTRSRPLRADPIYSESSRGLLE